MHSADADSASDDEVSEARSRGQRIPIAISARHAHLTQKTLDSLFGPRHQLHPHAALSQPGRIDSDGRDLIFGDVTVRVACGFSLELHLDTDEANAAGVEHGQEAELITPEAFADR